MTRARAAAPRIARAATPPVARNRASGVATRRDPRSSRGMAAARVSAMRAPRRGGNRSFPTLDAPRHATARDKSTRGGSPTTPFRRRAAASATPIGARTSRNGGASRKIAGRPAKSCSRKPRIKGARPRRRKQSRPRSPSGQFRTPTPACANRAGRWAAIPRPPTRSCSTPPCIPAIAS